jgi:hypothetical protein
VLQYYRMTLWALLITGEVGSATERNHLGGNHLGWRHLRWRHPGRRIPGQCTVVTMSNTRYDAIVLHSKRCAFLVRCRLLPERATGTRTAVGNNLCMRYCTEYTHSDLLHTDSCSYRQPSLHPDRAETPTKNLPTVLPACHPVPRSSHRYTTLLPRFAYRMEHDVSDVKTAMIMAIMLSHAPSWLCSSCLAPHLGHRESASQ